ncbi:hypothetical protein COO60DRAFT_181627 [Scenedesmus sp. NREL 46B-D3]|nr:hypothetical protein COO60DRAFT_181627 [Scenedesmus sp. NREL 46B-D3]
MQHAAGCQSSTKLAADKEPCLNGQKNTCWKPFNGLCVNKVVGCTPVATHCCCPCCLHHCSAAATLAQVLGRRDARVHGRGRAVPVGQPPQLHHHRRQHDARVPGGRAQDRPSGGAHQRAPRVPQPHHQQDPWPVQGPRGRAHTPLSSSSGSGSGSGSMHRGYTRRCIMYVSGAARPRGCLWLNLRLPCGGTWHWGDWPAAAAAVLCASRFATRSSE